MLDELIAKSEPHLLVLDLGGIVIPERNKRIVQKVAYSFGIDEQRLRTSLGYFQVAVSTGNLRLLQAYDFAFKENGRHERPSDVLNVHLDEFQKLCGVPDAEMVKWIQDERKKRMVVCLTNTEPEVSEVVEQMGIFECFDSAFVSTRTGVMKPQRTCFSGLLDKLGYSAKEALFVDDNFVNVDAARRIGIRSERWENPQVLYQNVVDGNDDLVYSDGEALSLPNKPYWNAANTRRSVHWIIKTRDGRLVFQRRPSDHFVASGRIDFCCGGQLNECESYVEGARREFFEEMSVDAPFARELFKMRHCVPGVDDSWYTIFGGVVNPFVLVPRDDAGRLVYLTHDEVYDKVGSGELSGSLEKALRNIKLRGVAL